MSIIRKLQTAVVLCAVVALVYGGYRLYDYVHGLQDTNTRLYSNLVGAEQTYEQLDAYNAKLQIDYKTQTDLHDKTVADFQGQIAQLQGRLKLLTDATFSGEGSTRKQIAQDVVSDAFVADEVRLPDGPPLGYVKALKDGTTESHFYKSKIDVYAATAQDEKTGRYTVLNRADYTLLEDPIAPDSKTWVNKAYHLPITAGHAEIDPTQPIVQSKRFYLWNPKADLNLSTDGQRLAAGGGINLMSYGLTTNDSDFKFLEVGVQEYDSAFEFLVVPALWRPFPKWTSNTFFGPGISFGNSGQRYLLSVSVGL